MKNEQNQHWCSMKPLLFSIVPIGIAVSIVWLTYLFRPSRRSEWFEAWDIIPCCIGPIISVVMATMGIYSVKSGVAAIRRPETRGKPLIIVAITLGILDIVIGAGYVFWIFSVYWL